MSYAKSPRRPGLTALAAVIALFSTPLLAQSVEPVASEPAPVLVAPPPPMVAPAPVADPVTPPATTMAPIVHQPDLSTSEAAPAPAPRTTSRAVTRTTQARTTTAPAAPAASAVTTPAPVAATPAPSPTTAPSSAVPASSAAWDDAGVPNPPAAQASETESSNAGLIQVAAIAAGILALGFGGFLLTRLRRREDDVVYESSVYDEPTLAPVPVEPAPAFFAGTAASAALPPDRPLADLPEDFDDSRYGPHVQAAYRGPTPENPSLSLKTRLKRARFFDERDRKAGVQGANTEAMIAHARSAREAHDDEQPVFWPHDRREDKERPAFQS